MKKPTTLSDVQKRALRKASFEWRHAGQFDEKDSTLRSLARRGLLLADYRPPVVPSAQRGFWVFRLPTPPANEYPMGYMQGRGAA